jgi:hypothetical protein
MHRPEYILREHQEVPRAATTSVYMLFPSGSFRFTQPVTLFEESLIALVPRPTLSLPVRQGGIETSRILKLRHDYL